MSTPLGLGPHITPQPRAARDGGSPGGAPARSSSSTKIGSRTRARPGCSEASGAGASEPSWGHDAGHPANPVVNCGCRQHDHALALPFQEMRRIRPFCASLWEISALLWEDQASSPEGGSHGWSTLGSPSPRGRRKAGTTRAHFTTTRSPKLPHWTHWGRRSNVVATNGASSRSHGAAEAQGFGCVVQLGPKRRKSCPWRGALGGCELQARAADG